MARGITSWHAKKWSKTGNKDSWKKGPAHGRDGFPNKKRTAHGQTARRKKLGLRRAQIKVGSKFNKGQRFLSGQAKTDVKFAGRPRRKDVEGSII